MWHSLHLPQLLLQRNAGIAGDPHLVHEAPEELIVTLESLHKALRREHPQTLPVSGHLQAPPPLSLLGLGLSHHCAGGAHALCLSRRLLPDLQCCREMPGVQHQLW